MFPETNFPAHALGTSWNLIRRSVKATGRSTFTAQSFYYQSFYFGLLSLFIVSLFILAFQIS